MFVYKISPILSYSPFLELTYFSSVNFPLGSVVEVVLMHKRVLGIVVHSESLLEAKQEIRTANFKTQKIATQNLKDCFVIPEYMFKELLFFSEHNGVAVGEVFAYFFDDLDECKKIIRENFNSSKHDVYKKVKACSISFTDKMKVYENIFAASPTKNLEKVIIVFADDVSLKMAQNIYKDVLKKQKHILLLKPKEALEALKKYEGGSGGEVELYIDDVSFYKYHLVQKPHINQLKALTLFINWRADIFKHIHFFSQDFGTEEVLYFQKMGKEIEKYEQSFTPKKFFVNLDKRDVEYKIKKKDIIQKEVLEKIKEKVAAGGKVFVFVLNHGYTQRIYCSDCNAAYSCHACKNPYRLTVSEEGNFLYCKVCETKRKLTDSQVLLCGTCGGFDFEEWGLGIQKVFDFLKNKNEFFGEISTTSLDEEVKKIPDGKLVQQVYDLQSSEAGSIVVGTVRALRAASQAFDMSVVVSLGDLARETFDADERHRELLLSIEQKSKEMYVQRILDEEKTLHVSPLLKSQENKISIEIQKKQKKQKDFFQKYKDLDFIKSELIYRKENNLPPYGQVVTLSFPFKHKKDALQLESIRAKAGEYVKKNKIITMYFFSQEEVEVMMNFIATARSFADVCTSSTVRDFAAFSK